MCKIRHKLEYLRLPFNKIKNCYVHNSQKHNLINSLKKKSPIFSFFSVHSFKLSALKVREYLCKFFFYNQFETIQKQANLPFLSRDYETRQIKNCSSIKD